MKMSENYCMYVLGTQTQSLKPLQEPAGDQAQLLPVLDSRFLGTYAGIYQNVLPAYLEQQAVQAQSHPVLPVGDH